MTTITTNPPAALGNILITETTYTDDVVTSTGEALTVSRSVTSVSIEDLRALAPTLVTEMPHIQGVEPRVDDISVLYALVNELRAEVAALKNGG